MNLPKHESLFSVERLRRYINACNGNPDRAVELYKYNIQASQALYPSISVLEVALRNAIDKVVGNYFKDNQWLLAKTNDFADHQLMVNRDKSGNILFDKFFNVGLHKAKERLLIKNLPVTHGKLLSELTFGFWVKFFDSNSVRILKGTSLEAFLNKPNKNLSQIYAHLKSIVNLRNRIAHNEPICFKNGTVCLTTIHEYETKIMEALGWIDTDLRNWCEKMNFLKPVRLRIATLQTLALSE